jgi:Mg2+ and Co2+ transporter CorA
MGLLRLMGNKADVVKGLAKRCNEHWSIAPKSEIVRVTVINNRILLSLVGIVPLRYSGITISQLIALIIISLTRIT